MLIMSSNTILLNNTKSALHFLAMSVLTRQVNSLVQLLFCMALNVSITSIKNVLTFYNPNW